jgi:hypothetical protein
MTNAKTILRLSTYDFDNLARLAAVTGERKAVAFHTPLDFCNTATGYIRDGYCVSAIYEDSYARYTTETLSPVSVAQSINNRRKDMETEQTALPLYRVTADRLENIKRFLKTDSDTLAVAFALEFARAALDNTHRANKGKKATVFFSRENDPGRKGYLLSSRHPYNANLGNTFRRAVRRTKSALAQMNPLARKKAIPPALPAPAPQPLPAQAGQPVQEIRLLNPPTISKRTPNEGGQDKRGGFGL